MSNKNKKSGCTTGCAFLLVEALLIIIAIANGRNDIAGILTLLLFVTALVFKLRLIFSYDPNAPEDKTLDSEPVKSDSPSETKEDEVVEYIPQFEIRYRKSKNDETVRKISIVKLGEFLYAYCFLRGAICTFAFSKIIECVDLSTGESVKEDLRIYYAKSRVKTLKPIEVFDLLYWEPIRYSSFMDLPAEISGFKLNQKFVMDIVTFKYGERKEEFICNRVIGKKNEAERFCVELIDSSNKKLYVGMSKIISVEGIEDFGEYLTEKFYESKADNDALS